MKRAARLLALLFLPLAACRDVSGPGNPTPSAVRGEVTAGDRQTGTVGDTLAQRVTVRVTDVNGRPVPGVTLEWRVLSERGGEFRFPQTRTDAEGRTTNAWRVGTRAGDHLAEVAAAIEGRREVLDTVYATARAGPPQRLELVGDTVRFAALDDTLRLALRGEDRFGNVIPASDLRPRWSPSDPEVASVDSTGAARVVGFGGAVLSATAGSTVARLRLVVDARMEVFPVMAEGTPQRVTFAQNGPRLVVLAEFWRSVARSFVAFDFDNGRWGYTALGMNGAAWYRTPLHVNPRGTAHMVIGSGLLASPAPRVWTAVPEWGRAVAVDGVGNTLFLLAPRSGSSSSDSLTVYRSSGTETTDLQLPRSSLTYRSYSTIAAAGENEVYVTTRDGPMMHWNGSAWRPVQGPEGFTGVTLELASHPQGGPVLAYGYASRVHLLQAGRAEVLSNPFTDVNVEVRGAAVSQAGQPYLVSDGAVAFRTAGGWRKYALRGDWYGQAVWPDATPGVLWVAVTRRASSAVTPYESELLFVRIRTGIR